MDNKSIQYSSEIKQAVIDEATSRLQAGGMLSQVAALTYGTDDIELIFIGKRSEAAVGVVQSVIAELAPGLPLKIIEYAIVITQTP